MNAKQGIFIGVIFAFLVMGFVSMQRAMPEAKEERIYKEITLYSPYRVEKRMGGLSLVNKQTGTTEKPSAAEFYHRLDEVQKEWGKEHLKVVGNEVEILGDNNQTIVKIFIETEKEKAFVKSFYGI
jgi:hypothetical protein